MFNLIKFNSNIIKLDNSYSVIGKLMDYSTNSFVFNLYYNSFLDQNYSKDLKFRDLLANSISFNGFLFNDIDNKEFCCLFLLTFLNIIIGFFPNTLFFFY